jgi:hypothetical protein
MKCKNCGHRVIFYRMKWQHWNEIIHNKGSCYCKKPEPKHKTLNIYKGEKI